MNPGTAGGRTAGADDLDAALDAFARRDAVLVAVDFDGTLAPLERDPMLARPLPTARDALAVLAGLPGTHVALVSGRAVRDLRDLADPPREAVLVASHGAEVVVPGGSVSATGNGAAPMPPRDGSLAAGPAALHERLRSQVAAITGRHPGTTVEVKPTSVVLHTRGAARDVADAATAETLEGPATWPGVHVTPGKEVVELAVTDSTKGRALQELRTGLGLPRGGVLYLGDDVTDERAFAVLDDDGGDVTVKVGEGPTVARHRVAGPQDVAALLARLAAVRSRAAGAPAGPPGGSA